MQTIIVDILNSKAEKLLRDLEDLELIRMHKETERLTPVNWAAKYKGAMTRQTLDEVDNQLSELRNG